MGRDCFENSKSSVVSEGPAAEHSERSQRSVGFAHFRTDHGI